MTSPPKCWSETQTSNYSYEWSAKRFTDFQHLGGLGESRTRVLQRRPHLHTMRTCCRPLWSSCAYVSEWLRSQPLWLSCATAIFRARLRASTIRLFNSVRKPSLRPPVGLSLIGSNHTELGDGCQACRIVPRFDRKRGLERVPSPSGVPDNLSQRAVTSGTHIITVRDPACYFAQVFERQITSPPCLGIDLLEVHCIHATHTFLCGPHILESRRCVFSK